ncbi:MAG: hypothetical protein MUE69_09875 [Myxococcota bacterium]|nr:hypothetical protein [Myxococcota bacterium]
MSHAVHPRLITENACVALTRRTSFRKAFLAPWAGSSRDEVSGADALRRESTSSPRWDEVGQIFAYAAAMAQRATKIDWHQLVLNVTHHHSQATPRDRELAEATRILHRTTACALNWLLQERGFDAPGSVWDKRQTSWTTLVDVEAVIGRAIYDDVNCVAAGWVAHPHDVPLGQHLGFELWKAGGIAVPKPENEVFSSKKLPRELELRLTPPIALVREFDGDLDTIVAYLTELRDTQCVQLAKERVGPVRGVKKMRAVHPWDEPDTEREVVGWPVPTFAVGRPGDQGVRLRAHCRSESYAHRDAHRARIVRWKAGDRTSPFPAGTLRGHTFLGMPLDVPAFGAILGAPHPSREEVEAELAEKRARAAKLEEARRERMRVREARRERARELAELEDLERELEDEARRVLVIDFELLKRPAQRPSVDGTPEPKIVRRGLDDARVTKTEGERVIVLRTRDAEARKKSKRRRRRGANDPPA